MIFAFLYSFFCAVTGKIGEIVQDAYIFII